MPRKIIALALSICFICQQAGFGQLVQAPVVLNSGHFRPLHTRYLSYNPLENTFRLLLDKGDEKDLSQPHIQEATDTLMKHFQVGLALPNSCFWVNLRPDAEDEIIDPLLEKTDLGRIMLEADLQLKKDVASMTDPATPQGRKYWDQVYRKAGELFGTGQDMEIPTLTRPWIVPGEIIIGESPSGAYIYKATLKVMLEQDYLKDSPFYRFDDPRKKQINTYASELIKQLILPDLNKEINSAKRYASLRQVYFSLILAQWFKAQYGPQQKTSASSYIAGIDKRDLTGLTSRESWSKNTYFKSYRESFEKGEYSKEETVSTPDGLVIRQYVSGGVKLDIMDKLQGFFATVKADFANLLNDENGNFLLEIFGRKDSTSTKDRQVDALERLSAEAVRSEFETFLNNVRGEKEIQAAYWVNEETGEIEAEVINRYPEQLHQDALSKDLQQIAVKNKEEPEYIQWVTEHTDQGNKLVSSPAWLVPVRIAEELFVVVLDAGKADDPTRKPEFSRERLNALRSRLLNMDSLVAQKNLPGGAARDGGTAKQNIYLIQGRAGSGKSTAIRFLAKLFPAFIELYDKQKHGSLNEYIAYCRESGKMAVLSTDEFKTEFFDDFGENGFLETAKRAWLLKEQKALALGDTTAARQARKNYELYCAEYSFAGVSYNPVEYFQFLAGQFEAMRSTHADEMEQWLSRTDSSLPAFLGEAEQPLFAEIVKYLRPSPGGSYKDKWTLLFVNDDIDAFVTGNGVERFHSAIKALGDRTSDSFMPAFIIESSGFNSSEGALIDQLAEEKGTEINRVFFDIPLALSAERSLGRKNKVFDLLGGLERVYLRDYIDNWSNPQIEDEAARQTVNVNVLRAGQADLLFHEASGSAEVEKQLKDYFTYRLDLGGKDYKQLTDAEVDTIVDALGLEGYFSLLGGAKGSSRQELRNLIRSFYEENGGFDVINDGQTLLGPYGANVGNEKYHVLLWGQTRLVSQKSYAVSAIKKLFFRLGPLFGVGNGAAAGSAAELKDHWGDIVAEGTAITFSLSSTQFAQLVAMTLDWALKNDPSARGQDVTERMQQGQLKDVLQSYPGVDTLCRIKTPKEVERESGIDKGTAQFYAKNLAAHEYVYQDKNGRWFVMDSEVYSAIKRSSAVQYFLQGANGQEIDIQKIYGMDNTPYLVAAQNLYEVETKNGRFAEEFSSGNPATVYFLDMKTIADQKDRAAYLKEATRITIGYTDSAGQRRSIETDISIDGVIDPVRILHEQGITAAVATGIDISMPAAWQLYRLDMQAYEDKIERSAGYSLDNFRTEIERRGYDLTDRLEPSTVSAQALYDQLKGQGYTFMGVVTSSGLGINQEDIPKAISALKEAWKDLDPAKTIIVCGATGNKEQDNLSGVELVYNVAESMGFKTMGIMSGKGFGYPVRQLDYLLVKGEGWGDESELLYLYSDGMTAFTGGNQAATELSEYIDRVSADKTKSLDVTLINGVRTQLANNQGSLVGTLDDPAIVAKVREHKGKVILAPKQVQEGPGEMQRLIENRLTGSTMETLQADWERAVSSGTGAERVYLAENPGSRFMKLISSALDQAQAQNMVGKTDLGQTLRQELFEAITLWIKFRNLSRPRDLAALDFAVLEVFIKEYMKNRDKEQLPSFAQRRAYLEQTYSGLMKQEGVSGEDAEAKLKEAWCVLRLVLERQLDEAVKDSWQYPKFKELTLREREGNDDARRIVTGAVGTAVNFEQVKGLPQYAFIIPDVHEGVTSLLEWAQAAGMIDARCDLIDRKGTQCIFQGDVLNRAVSSYGYTMLQMIEKWDRQAKEYNERHGYQGTDAIQVKLILGNQDMDVLKNGLDEQYSLAGFAGEFGVNLVRKKLFELIQSDVAIAGWYMGSDPQNGIQMFHAGLMPGVKKALLAEMQEQIASGQLDAATYSLNDRGIVAYTNKILKDTFAGVKPNGPDGSFDGTETVSCTHYIFGKSRSRGGEEEFSGIWEADVGNFTGNDLYAELESMGILAQAGGEYKLQIPLAEAQRKVKTAFGLQIVGHSFDSGVTAQSRPMSAADVILSNVLIVDNGRNQVENPYHQNVNGGLVMSKGIIYEVNALTRRPTAQEQQPLESEVHYNENIEVETRQAEPAPAFQSFADTDSKQIESTNDLYKELRLRLSPEAIATQIPQRDLQLMAEYGTIKKIPAGRLSLDPGDIVIGLSGTFTLMENGKAVSSAEIGKGIFERCCILARGPPPSSLEMRVDSAGAEVLVLKDPGGDVLENNPSLQNTLEQILPAIYSEQYANIMKYGYTIQNIKPGDTVFKYLYRSKKSGLNPRPKIGIFPVSGNPFHNNHRDIILEALKNGMDEVIVVFSPHHVVKAPLSAAELAVRSEMVYQTFQGDPRVSIGVAGNSYYTQIVSAVKQEMPEADLYLMMGMDNLEDTLVQAPVSPLDELQDVFKNGSLIVNKRDGLGDDTITSTLKAQLGEHYTEDIRNRVTFNDINNESVSSSLVRVLVADGESLWKQWCEPGVAKLIETLQLYKGPVSAEDRSKVFQESKELITKAVQEGKLDKTKWDALIQQDGTARDGGTGEMGLQQWTDFLEKMKVSVKEWARRNDQELAKGAADLSAVAEKSGKPSNTEVIKQNNRGILKLLQDQASPEDLERAVQNNLLVSDDINSTSSGIRQLVSLMSQVLTLEKYSEYHAVCAKALNVLFERASSQLRQHIESQSPEAFRTVFSIGMSSVAGVGGYEGLSQKSTDRFIAVLAEALADNGVNKTMKSEIISAMVKIYQATDLTRNASEIRFSILEKLINAFEQDEHVWIGQEFTVPVWDSLKSAIMHENVSATLVEKFLPEETSSATAAHLRLGFLLLMTAQDQELLQAVTRNARFDPQVRLYAALRLSANKGPGVDSQAWRAEVTEIARQVYAQASGPEHRLDPALSENIWLQDEELKVYIFATYLMMQQDVPALFSGMEDPAGIPGQIYSNAILVPQDKETDMDLKIGGKIFEQTDMFYNNAHELTHIALYEKGFSAFSVGVLVIHEFLADLGGMSFLLARGDEKGIDQLLRDWKNAQYVYDGEFSNEYLIEKGADPYHAFPRSLLYQIWQSLESLDMSQRREVFAVIADNANKLLFGEQKEYDTLPAFLEDVFSRQEKERVVVAARDGGTDRGGIDFRALPLNGQAIGVPLVPRVDINRWLQARSAQPAMQLESEWQELQQLVSRGQMPSSQRLMAYALACSGCADSTQRIAKLQLCVIDIMRLQEDQCLPVDEDLKQVLALVSSSEYAAALARELNG